MAAAGEDFSKETAVAAARPSRAAMSARARVRSFALKKSGDQARLACVCVDCDGGGGGAGLKEMGGERDAGLGRDFTEIEGKRKKSGGW